MSSQAVAITLATLVAIIFLWDLYLYRDDVEGNSITQITRKYLKRKLGAFWLGAFIGFWVGHLFGDF